MVEVEQKQLYAFASFRLRNSVPFGQAPWEPSTEAGYEPDMTMCLGSHGAAKGRTPGEPEGGRPC